MILMKALLERVDRKYGGVNTPKGRESIGMYSGFIGLGLNLFLTLTKLVVGLLSRSISIVADAMNNLSDAISSLVIILGIRIANTPPDRNHPYGHGRMEYITGLVVSFLVLGMGLQFAYQSIVRLINPVPLVYHKATLFFLVLSIFIKLLMRVSYMTVYKKTDILALRATAADAAGDVMITSVVLLAYILGNQTTLPTDGVAGLVVSILIIKSGAELIKETTSPLLGEAPDPALVEAINNRALEEPEVLGTHDLCIHNYGPGIHMATMDVEFGAHLSVMHIHNVLDTIEKDVEEKYGVKLVLHADPIELRTLEEDRLYKDLKRWIKSRDDLMDLHDFRFVESEGGEPSIHFELTVDGEISQHLHELQVYEEEAQALVEKHFPDYASHVGVDVGFRKNPGKKARIKK